MSRGAGGRSAPAGGRTGRGGATVGRSANLNTVATTVHTQPAGASADWTPHVVAAPTGTTSQFNWIAIAALVLIVIYFERNS